MTHIHARRRYPRDRYNGACYQDLRILARWPDIPPHRQPRRRFRLPMADVLLVPVAIVAVVLLILVLNAIGRAIGAGHGG